MLKNYLKYLVYTLIILFSGCMVTFAAASVKVQNDLLIVDDPNGQISGLWYGTSTIFSEAKLFTSAGGSMTTKSGSVSVKNGSYYVWVMYANGATKKRLNSSPLVVTDSCRDDYPTGITGSVSLERCYIWYYKNGSAVNGIEGSSPTVCANGYTMTGKVDYTNKDSRKLMGGLNRRYFKVGMTFTCSPATPPQVPAPSLTGLSVSPGSLAFNSGTKKYTVNVGAEVTSIKVSATAAEGSSFASGLGPRTVKLNYGANAVKVKVTNSAGAAVTYTITVNRADNRSGVNTLSNLTVSAGTLSPAFASGTTNYTVEVPNEITSITVDATLTDNSSSFAAGYGPSAFTLEPGPNKIYIKVVSQKGSTNVYNITVNRATTPSRCTTETDNLALLKGIQFSVDMQGVELDQIEEFDPRNFTYADIKVPFKASYVNIQPYVQEEGDTYVIEGNSDLEVNVTKEIRITVTSKSCPNYSNVYTLNITRQPEKVLGDIADLESLTIDKHDEFKFEPNTMEYKLILKKNEKKLGIKFETVQKGTQCVVEGNENLKYASVVIVKCVSEDGEDTAEYNIIVDGVEKGTNVFLIIILVIIIICILVYLVLRLLGYKIYFNTAVIGAFFRGMGEKVKNVFDK